MADSLANKKVLLVEDDYWIREVYKMALRQRDLIVVEASDGAEAIEVFNKEKPDLVLLDIMLPVMSGLEVLKYVRKEALNNRNTPIFLITNVDTADIFDQAEQNNPDGFYLKSRITPQQITDKVVLLLGSEK